MSTDLVPINSGLAEGEERRRFLERLNRAAENTNDLAEARQIMVQGSALVDLLTQARAPFDEARMAGKASTLAARRLGKLLSQISSKAKYGNSEGANPSDRRIAAERIGIAKPLLRNLVLLARVKDADFQRYIQRSDTIPTLTGALGVFYPKRTESVSGRHLRSKKRRLKAGVKPAAHPSLDESYSLIVRSLGHLCEINHSGQSMRSRAIVRAMEHLYAAEDLLKPYRGGYVK